jgi:hypothetical protein
MRFEAPAGALREAAEHLLVVAGADDREVVGVARRVAEPERPRAGGLPSSYISAKIGAPALCAAAVTSFGV